MKTNIIDQIKELYDLQNKIYENAKIEVDDVYDDINNPIREFFLIAFIPYHVGNMLDMLRELRLQKKNIQNKDL